jgi:hypothetical protein
MLSLTLSDGKEQTRAIMTALARADSAEKVDRKRWHALHQCIAGSSGL